MPVAVLFVHHPANELPSLHVIPLGTVTLVPEATVCGLGCPDAEPVQLVVMSYVMVGLTVIL